MAFLGLAACGNDPPVADAPTVIVTIPGPVTLGTTAVAVSSTGGPAPPTVSPLVQQETLPPEFTASQEPPETLPPDFTGPNLISTPGAPEQLPTLPGVPATFSGAAPAASVELDSLPPEVAPPISVIELPTTTSCAEGGEPTLPIAVPPSSSIVTVATAAPCDDDQESETLPTDFPPSETVIDTADPEGT